MDHKKYSNMLALAESSPKQIQALTNVECSMSVEDAYKIQLETVRRWESSGEKIVGMKIGLTSQGMQKLLGVNEPDYGHLTQKMQIIDGGTCFLKSLLQPKVEGELAFCLKKMLKGPNISEIDVFDATEWVSPAIEIVDSRLMDWKIKLADTIADNGSSAKFVLGSKKLPVSEVDMRLTGMTLEKNGLLVNSGTSAEVMGNPTSAVAWLANKLSEFDINLPAGSIILSGAFTAAVSAEKGDNFVVSMYGLGDVTVNFE